MLENTQGIHSIKPDRGFIRKRTETEISKRKISGDNQNNYEINTNNNKDLINVKVNAEYNHINSNKMDQIELASSDNRIKPKFKISNKSKTQIENREKNKMLNEHEISGKKILKRKLKEGDKKKKTKLKCLEKHNQEKTKKIKVEIENKISDKQEKLERKLKKDNKKKKTKLKSLDEQGDQITEHSKLLDCNDKVESRAINNDDLSDYKLVKLNYLTGQSYSENYKRILEQRNNLPIQTYKQEFLGLLNDSTNDVIVLEGETGSGKTTQIPQWCLEWLHSTAKDEWHKVCCTQPRRVAAMSVATRVAQEMDVDLGKEVGYSIRFEDMTSERTRLKYMTDGMLLREIISDRELSKYAVVILDEVHERTIANDILMGLLKQLITHKNYQQRDCSLKVIIMSATLNAKQFSKYFRSAPMLKVPGSIYEVDHYHSVEPVDDLVEASVDIVMQIYTKYPKVPGDILVFLTGEQLIEETCEKIRRDINNVNRKYGDVKVVPLYSSLDISQQQLVFSRAPSVNTDGFVGRKVVVATNIAETSLTIDGVVFVIDCGLTKFNIFNAQTHTYRLAIVPVSMSSALQRSGRAGRTRPGKCFRLYTQSSFNQLEVDTAPEIVRSSVEDVILRLLKLGVTDIVNFPYMTSPPRDSLISGLDLLFNLKLVKSAPLQLTELGHKLSEMPLDPQMGKMLLTSIELGCVEEILSISAMLSVPNCFLRPPTDKSAADRARNAFRHDYGDHLALLNVYNGFVESGQSHQWAYDNYLNIRSLKCAINVRNQLKRHIKPYLYQGTRQEHEEDSSDSCARNICRAILSGYYCQVGHLQRGGYYATVQKSQRADLHPSCSLLSGNNSFNRNSVTSSSTLRPEWIVYNECVTSAALSGTCLRTVSCIRPEWMLEIAPDYFQIERIPHEATRAELQAVLHTVKRRSIRK